MGLPVPWFDVRCRRHTAARTRRQAARAHGSAGSLIGDIASAVFSQQLRSISKPTTPARSDSEAQVPRPRLAADSGPTNAPAPGAAAATTAATPTRDSAAEPPATEQIEQQR